MTARIHLHPDAGRSCRRAPSSVGILNGVSPSSPRSRRKANLPTSCSTSTPPTRRSGCPASASTPATSSSTRRCLRPPRPSHRRPGLRELRWVLRTWRRALARRASQSFFIEGPMETPRDIARELARFRPQAVLAGTVDPQRATFARDALTRARDMLEASAKGRRQHPEHYIPMPEGTRLPTDAEVEYMRENGGKVPPGTRPAVEHLLLVGPEWTPPGSAVTSGRRARRRRGQQPPHAPARAPGLNRHFCPAGSSGGPAKTAARLFLCFSYSER